jgi:hypothetical protein
MAGGTPTKTAGEALPNAAGSAADSGVWARPDHVARRHQEGPLGGPERLPPWLGWCAALVFFIGVTAIVLGTLLQLTRELVELGHHPDARPSVDER